MTTTHDDSRLVERAKRANVGHRSEEYGRSREGSALMVFLPREGLPEILVLAAIHGDEPETTVVASEALRAVRTESLKNAVVLCANPDGIARGTRGNARGVDLNRNFPASNWSAEMVHFKGRREGPRDIEISPGERAGSEPETRALIALLDRLRPRAVVAMHGALACIDDPDSSPLALWLADRTELPLDPVTYPTPGSFGSWAKERGLPVVTWELEPASLYDLKERHVPVLIDLLTGAVDLGA